MNYRLEYINGAEVDTFDTEEEAHAIREAMESLGQEDLRVVPWG